MKWVSVANLKKGFTIVIYDYGKYKTLTYFMHLSIG